MFGHVGFARIAGSPGYVDLDNPVFLQLKHISVCFALAQGAEVGVAPGARNYPVRNRVDKVSHLEPCSSLRVAVQPVCAALLSFLPPALLLCVYPSCFFFSTQSRLLHF